MEKRYVSFDVETSGSSPGKYSMLSLGACLVDDPSITFYRELKPISMNFILEAMLVGCKGLKCLDGLKQFKWYNPENTGFMPEKVLELLDVGGENPNKVMVDYA